jgi:hypothetical protein
MTRLNLEVDMRTWDLEKKITDALRRGKITGQERKKRDRLHLALNPVKSPCETEHGHWGSVYHRIQKIALNKKGDIS